MPPLFLSFAIRSVQRRHLLDVAVGDCLADARQILHDHAPGADIEMADLGIAHLAAGQADVVARSAQKAMRSVPPQPVEGRRIGLADGIVGGIVAPTPAVENDQHHRPPPLHVAKSFRSDNAERGIADRHGSVNQRALLPLPGGERAGEGVRKIQKTNSAVRTPSSCPSPLWGEGTQRRGCDLDLRYAAAPTCPASQPSMARLRVMPQ